MKNEVRPIDAKPLTLKQLREMDGQPVWGKSLINDKPGEWFIVRVVEMSKCWFIACAGASQGFGDKDTYAKTWLAYAYPPAHLDRDAWEPCEECQPRKLDHFILNRYGVKFCRHCGRPLTPEALSELEKRLRG